VSRPRLPRCGPVVLGGCISLVLALAFGPRCRAGSKTAHDDWPEITKEERALTSVPQDPDADAVILLHTRDGRIVPRGKYMVNVLEFHERIKILNDRGAHRGEVHLRGGKRWQITEIRARTVKADGTVLPVPEDQIFEKVILQSGGTKETEKVFHFPGVEPGAILEHRYVREERIVEIVDPWFFAGNAFTLYSRMSQAVPDDMHFRTMCDKCTDPEPSRTDWHEGKARGGRYTLEMRNVPAYRDELLMPPERDVVPRVEMVMTGWDDVYFEILRRVGVFFIDWPSIARFTDSYYQGAISLGQQSLKPLVAAWTQGATDPQEKVKAITRHVQSDFRYLPDDTVWWSTRPVEELLKDRTADNVEKAVLLAAALKTIGVQAPIALVAGKDKGTLYSSFPSISPFSHAIVALGSGDATQWIDPTATNAPFGFMPWRDSGAGALLMNGEQVQVVTLPRKDETNTTRYGVTIRPKADGKADVDVVAEYQGEDAIEWRDELLPASEADRAKAVQDWVQKDLPAADLHAQAIQDLEALDKPLRISFSVEAPGLVTKADNLMLVRTCVVGCLATNPISRARRVYPFFVDRGWNREESVTVVPPAGMKAAQMPPAVTAESAVGQFRLSCRPLGDGGAICKRSFVAPRGRWAASEGDDIRALFERIVEADRTTVPLQGGAASAAGR